MRDPDLVQRAERAATALERAWIHWRTMHGLGSDPLPPVSSYVGYSLEEPWGQPRVVFGVGAEEAERLAALLNGHDCYGPIHAEVTGRAEWRYAAASDPGSQGRILGDQVPVPAQAPPPPADMFAPGSYTGAAAVESATDDSAAVGGAVAVSAAPDSAVIDSAVIDSAVVDSAENDSAENDMALADTATIDTAAIDGAVIDGAATDSAPADASGGTTQREDAVNGNAVTPAPAAVASETGTANAPPAVASRRPRSRKVPPVSLQPVALGSRDGEADLYLPPFEDQGQRADPGSRAELQETAPPAIVALRGQLADPDEQAAPFAAAPIDASSSEILPSQGPGYRGPRYQGSPPQYEAGSDPYLDPSAPAPAPAPAPTPAADRDVAAGGGQRARGKSRQLNKLGRARRQGPGAHEAWDSADERSATDHAV